MKENKKPLLSICIPTYNRRYSLQNTLKSIIEQNEFKSWAVEIVISDNASTDETEKKIRGIYKVYNNIRYFKNELNIWGPANINKVLSLWEWEYLWLLGSDSLIEKNWLKKIFWVIANYQPNLLYNSTSFTPKFKMLKSNSFNNNLNAYHFNSTKEFLMFLWEQYFYDKNSFLFIEHLLTFISCICISKSFYIKAIDKINKSIWLDNFNKNYFSQELMCFVNNAESITVDYNYIISRMKSKKTTYFVNIWIVKDAFSLFKYLSVKYKMTNFWWYMLKNRSLIFFIKQLFIWKIIKIFMNIGLYKKCSYIWRKFILKNINEAKSFIEEIDDI